MISEKVFLKMLKSFTSAEMKFPIRFSDDNGKLLNEKFDFWYDQLKGIIREDLPDKIVREIVGSETEFPRIAKIRWWAERLECETIDPKKLAGMKKKKPELDKEQINTKIKSKGQKPRWPWSKSPKDSGKETDIETVNCEDCQRPHQKDKTCICVKMKSDIERMKKHYGNRIY